MSRMKELWSRFQQQPTILQMFVIIGLSLAAFVWALVFLAQRYDTPAIVFSAGAYPAFPSQTCAGDEVRYTSELVSQEAVDLTITRTIRRTRLDGSRETVALVDQRAFSLEEGDAGPVRSAFIVPSHDFRGDPLPPGEYYLLVSAKRLGAGDAPARFRVPFAIMPCLGGP